ncbi:hypothetical protein [Dickeya poaceiphila]|nr:hypothetical protein [Dickeya poaceiphila]
MLSGIGIFAFVVQNEEGTFNLRLRAPYNDKLSQLEAFLNG